MNFKTITGNQLMIHMHEKCIIVNLTGIYPDSNQLFEFEQYQKVLDIINQLVDERVLTNIKSYMKNNLIVKSMMENSNEQLSLF